MSKAYTGKIKKAEKRIRVEQRKEQYNMKQQQAASQKIINKFSYETTKI